MPQQIKKLLIVFTIVFGIFFIIKYALKPKSFGEFGHYRGLAIIENENKQVKYVGIEACNECHDDIVSYKKEGPHVNLQCEVCHGPGYLHIQDPETNKLIIPSKRENCGICHQKNAARSENNITQVDLKEHNVENKCIDCHKSHNPYEFKD
ncbi:MAG: hypothetical protein L3J56_08890 [Bacteroidales bacterium]|nr:hypothetical protein [Bacteroidales bacterium]